MPDLALDISGLRKSFGNVVACEDLTLQVEVGQIAGLVGPDGAGKTTSFRMLCGILPADGGHAMVGGAEVTTDPEAVKQHLGYLPQQFSLHRDLTIDENIRYMADLYMVPHAEWRARADELLDITYLTPFRKRLAGRLSGGMRQKLALVCSLIHRPRVLLLDEPTTGVDPVSRRDFWKILYDLPRQGVTILISTPYMDEAARCSKLAFMSEGSLLAVDTPQALRSRLPYQMIEVRCRPQREARTALQHEPGVASVEVFGDRLHIALRPGTTSDALKPALKAAGVECEEVSTVEPSLEDVFMALTLEGQTELSA
ncbi:MAG: ABC transporter ATP-binding protein [Armatimonadia bacterium]